MGLIDDLKPGPVALDTQVFIYFIEESKQFLPLVKPLFEAIDQGSLPAATSGLTLMEVLVVPYRTGNISFADRYEALLTRSRGLRLIDVVLSSKPRHNFAQPLSLSLPTRFKWQLRWWLTAARF